MAALSIRKVSVVAWRKLGSIHLTVALCLLLTADLAWGYFCLRWRTPLFAPLNDIGLVTWIETYGRHNLVYTAWFLILLVLLTLFCLNTCICTTDRVVALVRNRTRFTPRRLFFKFAPHLMHYALVIILAGYLGSYLFARVLDTRTLIPGSSMTLPDTTAHISFIAFEPEYYQAQRLPSFQNRVIRPKARLLLTDNGFQRSALLSFNQPLAFRGYTIFLKDFAPKQKAGGMVRQVRIDMTIRKDPGVPWYLAGILLFSAGLAMYLTEWMCFKKAS